MLDIIICANFGVEKLRGLGNTRSQILGSPVKMAGHPYNSAAIPHSLFTCSQTTTQPSGNHLIITRLGVEQITSSS